MAHLVTGIHVTNIIGLIGFLVLWIVLFECAHMLVSLLRHDPLIGWAIGPLGVTTLFLREPSPFFILLNVLFPALVSGVVLYVGLFTSLPSALVLPHYLLVEVIVVAVGILLTSTGDIVNALRDLRYPLWGEARILCSLQFLRASWASIHFTPFGLSYLRDHFGSSPSELLRAFS
jgi:hypothetical protein